jgi:hypothetical protein
MASLSDKIRIFLGMKVNTEDKTEPVVNQPAEVQVSPSVNTPLVNNEIYYRILRNALEPELEKQAEGVNPPVPEPEHANELERLKQYAELAKQNKLDNDALNEDLG